MRDNMREREREREGERERGREREREGERGREHTLKYPSFPKYIMRLHKPQVLEWKDTL